ncbi:MAG: hypothetical protein ACRC8S_09740 [Fimbriiglobus sp.]
MAKNQKLILRIRLLAGQALSECPEAQWPILEHRIEDIHRLCDEGELEQALVMLLSFLCQNFASADDHLDELNDLAKRLSIGPTGSRLLAQLTRGM